MDTVPTSPIPEEDATPALVLGPAPDSTLTQWRAAADSLQRLNEALLRIGDAAEEIIYARIATT